MPPVVLRFLCGLLLNPDVFGSIEFASIRVHSRLTIGYCPLRLLTLYSAFLTPDQWLLIGGFDLPVRLLCRGL